MEPATSLTTTQQLVITALAAGSTVSGAAETYSLHRVTVYRWMKTSKAFAEALQHARNEFILARRDQLYHLSTRALESLLAILDNPESSPAVLLRTAMFILNRPQMPQHGWTMPEPAPDPNGEKIMDSAVVEQVYSSLRGLYGPGAPAPPLQNATQCNLISENPASVARALAAGVSEIADTNPKEILAQKRSALPD